MGLRSSRDFNLSDEEKLIINILKEERIKEIEKIDWKKFLTLIINEDVYPLFYNFFLKNENLISDKFFKIIEFLYERNKKRVSFLKERTIHILKKLKENNIRAIPLKGFLISERVYGDLYARSFGDIDLFVVKDDLFKIIDFLKEEGFTFVGGKNKEEFLKKFHFELYNEYQLYKENCLIELHFDILPKRFKKIKNFEKFMEFENFNIEDLEIHIFSKEWELIFLSLHSFLHKYSFLKFILDIHKFIKKFEKNIDFYKIYEISKRLNVLKIVKLSLTLSNFLFETKLPELLKFPTLPDFIKDFIFKEKEPSGIKKDVLPLFFINSFHHKLYYSISLLNPDKNVLKFFPSLPPSLFLFYYPIRLFLIIKNRFFK